MLSEAPDRVLLMSDLAALGLTFQVIPPTVSLEGSSFIVDLAPFGAPVSNLPATP
jgi:hypothetical protein